MPDKVSYKCSSCNWRFRRNYEPKLCPNCGKNFVVVDKNTGSADEILKEISDMENQFK